jgi:hypothetical protein
MAFHENAGLGQVDFDLPFLKFSLSFMAGGCSERPGAVKGAFFAPQRSKPTHPPTEPRPLRRMPS